MSKCIPEEVLELILQFHCYTIFDWCAARLACKFAYNICKDKFFQQYEEVFGARSFIQINRCVKCQNTFSYDLKFFRQYWRGPPACPAKIYVCCHNFHCCRSVIRSLLDDASEYGVCILLKEAVLSKEGRIQRTSGTLTNCIFQTGWLWKNNHAVRCYIENWMVKDVPIREIHNKYRKPYSVLTFDSI